MFLRRFILISMMLLLPLQWSWAAAGSVCEHEDGGQHFGHHAHQHHAADHGGHDDEAFGHHPDCDACHTLVAGCLTNPSVVHAAWAATAYVPTGVRQLPDPPPESLLRPPLTLVA